MTAVFEAWIVWGSSPDPGTRPERYAFDTQAELDAFRYGISEAEGWLGYDEADSYEFVVNDDGEIVPCDADGNPIEESEEDEE
jgi:hypothetical protein